MTVGTKQLATTARFDQVITGMQYGLKALSYVPYAGKFGAVAKVIGQKPLDMVGAVAGLGERIVTDITKEAPKEQSDSTNQALATAGKVASYGASALGIVGTGLELASPYLAGAALTTAELAVPGIGWAAAGASAASALFSAAQWLKA